MIIKSESTVSISIIIIIVLFVHTSNGEVCNNDVIKCYAETKSATCTIYHNNTEMINQAISLCSSGSFTLFNIEFNSSLQNDVIIITIDLPNNILKLNIEYGTVYLISTQIQPKLRSMNLEYLSVHLTENFLGHFPNLFHLSVKYSHFNAVPNFTVLKKLTSLRTDSANLTSSGYATINRDFIGGLTKLRYLNLYKCGIQIISTDAFSKLRSLTFLRLSINNLIELAPQVFTDLTELKILYLQNNIYDLRIPRDANNSNVFSPLKKLTLLSLSYTNSIPYDSFTTLSSIQQLELPMMSTGIVPNTLIQHLHKLTFLSFAGISLICNCSMQWASNVLKFDLDIQEARCSDVEENVWNSSLYTECVRKESYQCFNKSIYCNNLCINTPNSYICAPCDKGYGLSLTEDEDTCHDLDECLENQYLCQQKCRNTLGSYQCYCYPGYTLSTDLISCTDIDECSHPSWNKCKQHQCENKVGFYRCICNPGYQLAADGFSCYDLDECSNATLNTCTQHTCLNEIGNYTCVCNHGYQLDTGEQNCEDIDECNTSFLNRCGVSGDHQCMNQLGSFKCICIEGFQLDENNISCHDIDECINGNNSCNQHTCLNLVGSYTCSCGEGYQLTSNGTRCKDIDECNSLLLNKCGKNKCINQDGAYTCNCEDGFQLIGNKEKSCEDIDECVNQSSNTCAHRCINKQGNYTCECNDGFALVPIETSQGESVFICNDIDECELSSNPCSQLCINTYGSYYCDCGEAYKLDPTNVSLCALISNYINDTNTNLLSDREVNNYSNATFLIVVGCLVFFILTSILLLIALLSILIYLYYSKLAHNSQFQDISLKKQVNDKIYTDLASDYPLGNVELKSNSEKNQVNGSRELYTELNPEYSNELSQEISRTNQTEEKIYTEISPAYNKPCTNELQEISDKIQSDDIEYNEPDSDIVSPFHNSDLNYCKIPTQNSYEFMTCNDVDDYEYKDQYEKML